MISKLIVEYKVIYLWICICIILGGNGKYRLEDGKWLKFVFKFFI